VNIVDLKLIENQHDCGRRELVLIEKKRNKMKKRSSSRTFFAAELKVFKAWRRMELFVSTFNNQRPYF